jgi:hypothetical protein
VHRPQPVTRLDDVVGRRPSGDLRDDDLHRVVEQAQCRGLGGALRVLEHLRVLALQVLLRLTRPVVLVARGERGAATRPQPQRAEQRHLVVHRHGGHAQLTTGRVRLRAIDLHHGLPVDVAEGVVGRTRLDRHVRDLHEPADQREHRDEREADHHGPAAPGQATRGVRARFVTDCPGRLRLGARRVTHGVTGYGVFSTSESPRVTCVARPRTVDT